MSFSLLPYLQQYISPAFSGQTPPQLGEKKFTPQSSVAPQVRSDSTSPALQEPNRSGGLDFSALPQKLVPNTSLPNQQVNYLA